jgi:rhodanese-related sulfurtransferase
MRGHHAMLDAGAGEVYVLDVRPPGEFANGHLPSANNIPLMQLEKRMEELPSNRPVVAYCRGRYCLLAYAAVDLLRAKGFDAQRLDEGVIEWKLRKIVLEAKPPEAT